MFPELREALAGFDFSGADVTHRAIIEPSRIVPLRSDIVAPVVDVHPLHDDKTDSMALMETLREDFEIDEADAFYAMHATRLHGSALVGSFPQPEAEERAAKRARVQGYALVLRMLRP